MTITFECFGVVVRVSIHGRGLEREVRAILPPGWRTSMAQTRLRFGIRELGAGGYEVTAAGSPPRRDSTLDLALGYLDAQIRAAISARAPEHIFVHAGVVACGSGALLVPGASFSGKTTLVAALVGAGAAYYSDEFAVLDRDGRVHPYPRPLSVRSPDGLSARNHHAHEFGADVGREPASVAGVLVTHYEPGARWDPVRLTPAEATVHLLTNTVPARSRPEQALRTIGRSLASLRFAIRSPRAEAATVTAPLLTMLTAANPRPTGVGTFTGGSG